MEFKHISVLFGESIDALNIKPNGIYADGTLGGGGHSHGILSTNDSCRLIGIDQDLSLIHIFGDTDEIRNTDNTKSYIGTSGRLKGKNPFTQYLTIFDGETGAALYTTDYIPYDAAEDQYWGDGKAKYNSCLLYTSRCV